jgi:hypothetical protein
MSFMSSFQSRANSRSASAPGCARSPAWFSGLVAAGLLALACEGIPSEGLDVGDAVEARPESLREPPEGVVIDLGTAAIPTHPLEGFSLPERVGSRFASWSEGEVSTAAFELRGGAREYLVAFLAEPYHMLGDVPVAIRLNKQPLIDTTLARGWGAYRAVVSGQRVVAGRNHLSFHYAKTGRPSDFDPRSTDVRDLSVRFDQIQIQPITVRTELAFGSKNALAQAALGEGWARDASDRGTGTWTVGKRALIRFFVDSSEASAPYSLALVARAPRGVAERGVNLVLNGTPLGSLTFDERKTSAVLDVPAARLTRENELALEFSKLEAPSALDPSSKDTRLLGLRVFELTVAPKALAAK